MFYFTYQTLFENDYYLNQCCFLGPDSLFQMALASIGLLAQPQILSVLFHTFIVDTLSSAFAVHFGSSSAYMGSVLARPQLPVNEHVQTPIMYII